MNDKDWDNYLRAEPGTIFGEIKRQEIREQQQRDRNSTNLHSSSTSSGLSTDENTGLEGYVIGFITLAAVVATIVGIDYLFPNAAWYWYIAPCFGVAWIMRPLLNGPFYFLVRWITLLIYLVGAGLLVYFALQMFGYR